MINEQPLEFPPIQALEPPEIERLSSFEQVLERHLLGLMAGIGMIQVMFAAFAFIDRLNPTVPSKYSIVSMFVNTQFWAGCFLVSGILTLVSIRRPAVRALSTAIGAAAFGIWGGLCIALSFTSVRPIAWSIGFAVAMLGWVSYKLCLVWGVLTFDPAKAK